MPDPTPAPTPAPVAPAKASAPAAGVKTSEFWMSSAVILLNALLASGVVPHSSEVAAAIASVASLLAAFGYTAMRTWLKAQ